MRGYLEVLLEFLLDGSAHLAGVKSQASPLEAVGAVGAQHLVVQQRSSTAAAAAAAANPNALDASFLLLELLVLHILSVPLGRVNDNRGFI